MIAMLLNVLLVIADPPVISVDDGVALGSTFMDTLSTGFASNDFSAQRDLFADDVTWEWSGGVEGSGSRDEYFDTLAHTWQPLVSRFEPANVMVVVDTARGIVSIPHEALLDIDGRGCGGTCLFRGKNIFELRVNRAHQIVEFRGLWDPADAAMNACIAGASGPNLVQICASAYVNFRTGGADGLPLAEFWAADAVLDPKFPVDGWARQEGREAILKQISELGNHPGLVGFSVNPEEFVRIGNRVYVHERVATDAGGAFDGLAVHTFNAHGECTRTDTYHDSLKLSGGRR